MIPGHDTPWNRGVLEKKYIEKNKNKNWIIFSPVMKKWIKTNNNWFLPRMSKKGKFCLFVQILKFLVLIIGS